MAIAQAFGCHSARHGVSDLAATQHFAGPSGGDKRSYRACQRSSRKRRPRRRAALGRISRSGRARFHRAQTCGHRLHRLLLRNGWPPERLHDDARKLFGAMPPIPFALSCVARRPLSQHPSHQPRHRFHSWFLLSICLRRDGRAFAHAPARIRARSFSEIQDQLRYSCSFGSENLQKGLQARFAALPPAKRRVLNVMIWMNKLLTRERPRLWISRLLLAQVHAAFGGGLEAILVGGAFTEPQVLQFFYDLGIPVANAYGLTETCVGITANDLKPFRADTVGKPLPGMEVRIVNPAPDGVGEVSVRSKTVMAGYLNEPELTAETIVDGWLLTGDLGRFDGAGHLQLTGRKKNMIVTEGGKNIYPEHIETVFETLRGQQ